MNSDEVITQAMFRRMPWKNGKGETLELMKVEDDKGVKCRISQASIADSGTFSDFTGLERHLVLIAGNGIRLSHQSEPDDLSHHDLLQVLDIATFNGGDLTSSELIEGPIEDLNIMVRMSDTHAQVQAIYAPCEVLSHTKGQTYFYANQVCNVFINQGVKDLIMPKDSFLIMSSERRYSLRTGAGVLIEISDRKA